MGALVACAAWDGFLIWTLPMPEPLQPAPAPPSALDALPPRPPRPRFWLYTLVLVLVGVCAGLAALFTFYNQNIRLTSNSLEAARARWKAAGIRDYNADIAVGGSTQGEYHIQVRNGEVAPGCTSNRRPFEDLNLARVWTIDALLDDILPREIKQAEADPAAALMVQFDEKLGFPRVFMRSSGGTQTSMRVILHTDLTKPPVVIGPGAAPGGVGVGGRAPGGRRGGTQPSSAATQPSRPAASPPSAEASKPAS
jgi:hypothetical protein